MLSKKMHGQYISAFQRLVFCVTTKEATFFTNAIYLEIYLPVENEERGYVLLFFFLILIYVCWT